MHHRVYRPQVSPPAYAVLNVLTTALRVSTVGSWRVRCDEYVGTHCDIVIAAVRLSETVGSCAIRPDKYDGE